MTQDFIEQNVRMLLGDMMLQNIMLKARIAELEAEAAAAPAKPPVHNGKVKEAEARQ